VVGIRKFQVLQEHDDPEFIDAILQDSHRMISCALQLIVYFVYVSSLADGAGDRIVNCGVLACVNCAVSFLVFLFRADLNLKAAVTRVEIPPA